MATFQTEDGQERAIAFLSPLTSAEGLEVVMRELTLTLSRELFPYADNDSLPVQSTDIPATPSKGD